MLIFERSSASSQEKTRERIISADVWAMRPYVERGCDCLALEGWKGKQRNLIGRGGRESANRVGVSNGPRRRQLPQQHSSAVLVCVQDSRDRQPENPTRMNKTG
jgi:hypothetical protein